MNDLIKIVGVVFATIIAFIIPTLKAKNKELEKDLVSGENTIKILKQNAKINKDASSASFSKLSDELLSRQKNRASK
jgi:mannitol-specific phosphotransferase system IIBC component